MMIDFSRFLPIFENLGCQPTQTWRICLFFRWWCANTDSHFDLRLRLYEKNLWNKMANIFILPADLFPYLFSYFDTEDIIAFAFTCRVFRQICLDANVFRKMDFSRRPVSTKQQEIVKNFFRDRELTQHIREFNVSNLHVLNWQMDDQFEEFILSICPHLEALHVLDCEISLQRLCRILKQAPKLTTLSWSLWDFTSEDVEFFSESMKSCEAICFKNIRHLCLEILVSKSHIRVAKYLVSCFTDLEKLEIYTWRMVEKYYTRWSFPLPTDQFIPVLPQPSVENELQYLHSLMVVAMEGPLFANYYEYKFEQITNEVCRAELSDFVISFLSRKSNSTKWKKFWILPSIGISVEHFSLLHSDDFQSVEAVGANAVNELKTFLEKIGNNSVRSLHLFFPPDSDSIVEFCDSILTVGGHSLKLLRFSTYFCEVCAEQNVVLHKLFSRCLNITELDLLNCYFEEDICEPLSKLKHLSKVQLMQCAISSKYNTHEVEISKANMVTFLENCKNITHLDVRGCGGCHEHFSCRLTDDDLMGLAKLRNLKSLTLCSIRGITEWTFLQNISEHCKFLTMLRISAWRRFKNSPIPILMESSRFLKHLAISVDMPVLLDSEVFWNLLSHAKNLERLCIRCGYMGLINIPAAVETFKSLPRLHVLHLHSDNIENVEVFHRCMIKLSEKRESHHRFSFEIVTGYLRNTRMNHQRGHSLILNKTLPLNEVELCDKRPILDIPRL